jgi:hypothetical protein
MENCTMEIEFKTSRTRANLELVFINEIFEGEFHLDKKQKSFLYVPARGDRILLSQVTPAKARSLLKGELSRVYS